ncbi:MAG: DMT family transporter [Planctomycetes bacterium]|nr:DMT family transporter [Planctomycetota bacterium]
MPPSLRVLLAGAMFASGGALLKSCDFPSLQRAGLRAGIAALVLFALLPAARRRPDRRVLRLVLPYFGATVLFVIANSLTTAANAIFLQSTAPLWLLLFAPWLLGERPSRRDLLTFAGVAAGMVLCLLAPTEAQRTAPDPALGNLFALASGVCFGLLLLGLRWLARGGDDASAAALAWGNACALPLAFALMPLVGQRPIAGDAGDWVVIVALGVFQVGLAYVVLTAGLRLVPAVRASLLLMVEPALNPLLAFAVHGEAPAPLALGGGALILGSVTAGGLAARRRPPA